MIELPSLDPLDRRLNAFNSLLSDIRLEGKVTASSFVEGVSAQIASPVADFFKKPEPIQGIEAQLILGQTVRIFDQHCDYSWVQADHHHYVGWVKKCDLTSSVNTPTHRVAVPRTFSYTEPDLKSPRQSELSMGSLVFVDEFQENRGTRYAILQNGDSVIAAHLKPIGENETDYVAVAESLLHTPYLWGGDTAFGIDCSGLVSLTMQMAGNQVLRDSDMQAATIGRQIYPNGSDTKLRRGDLVFWKGHVAIMQNGETIIHANGHTMMVSIEPLREAINRIAYLYGEPIGYRRP